jgi:hypothetical protein
MSDKKKKSKKEIVNKEDYENEEEDQTYSQQRKMSTSSPLNKTIIPQKVKPQVIQNKLPPPPPPPPQPQPKQKMKSKKYDSYEDQQFQQEVDPPEDINLYSIYKPDSSKIDLIELQLVT